MKATLISGLAGVCLVLTATTTAAAQTSNAANTAKGGVGYDEAMACSALFSVLAGFSEGDPVEEELIDTAARWLIIAVDRKGLAGPEDAQDELLETSSNLLEELEMLDDDRLREDLLLEGLDVCEKARKAIASEFESGAP